MQQLRRLLLLRACRDAAQLLGDLWAFDLSSHTWQLIPAIGDKPLPRQSAALSATGTQVLLAGGEYYNPARQAWIHEGDVYVIDLAGNSPYWRRCGAGNPRLQQSQEGTE